jgi:hypothetical protein
MSDIVIVNLALKATIRVEVSGEDAIKRAIDHTTTQVMKQLHAGDSISDEVEIDFLHSRVEFTSVGGFHHGTGDMDK